MTSHRRRGVRRKPADLVTWGAELDDGIPWTELIRFNRQLERDGRIRDRTREAFDALESRIRAVLNDPDVRRSLAAQDDSDDHFALHVWLRELLLRAESLAVFPSVDVLDSPAFRACRKAAAGLAKEGRHEHAASVRRIADELNPLREFPALDAYARRPGRRDHIGAVRAWIHRAIVAFYPTVSDATARRLAAKFAELSETEAATRRSGSATERAADRAAADAERVRQNIRSRSRR